MLLEGQFAEVSDELELLDSAESLASLEEVLPDESSDDEDDPPPLQEITRRLK